MTVRDYSEGLKVAIMINSVTIQKWQYDVIESLLSNTQIKPVLLIMPDKANVYPARLWYKIKNYQWKAILFKKYYQHFFKPSSFRLIEIPQLIANVPVLKCQTFRKRISEHFNDVDIETIKNYNPDFILKFGFGIIRGDILKVAPMGIWSYHHGDEQKYRGVPPAFWEIYYNNPKTGAILQRLTERLDSGVILRKGLFPTIPHSWRASLDQVISLSVHWPLDVCNEIIAQNTFPDQEEGVETNAPLYRAPGNVTFLAFLGKQFINKIKFHLDEIFYCEFWQTGIIKARTADILSELQYHIETEDVAWFSAKDKNSYYADGFAIKDHERLLLFFEDYSYKNRKGHISASWFSERDSSFSKPVVSLNETWHLSYPFIFKYENNIFCIPESKDHGSVELYQLEAATLKLNRVRTLLPDISAVDPTIINHKNHWYLFFTSGHATNIELNIWHSATLEGPFIPHVLNPVKSNISNSRSAGSLFYLDGKLYRPAQDCSRTYGGRVIINEVKILSEDAFLEMAVSVLEPPQGFEGIHNLSFSGDYMFFDCKRKGFSSANSLYQIKHKLGLI